MVERKCVKAKGGSTRPSVGPPNFEALDSAARTAEPRYAVPEDLWERWSEETSAVRCAGSKGQMPGADLARRQQ